MSISAPMIVLFTDFGADGPYVGQMKAVLAQHAPDAPVIDLLHTAPRFDVRASAHLLAAYVSAFPLGSIFLGVVDPGVGNAQRRPVVMKIAQHWFVGPDNGLFQVLAARAAERQAEIECWEINWRPENLSNTFHGRDVFAPVAARLARGELPPGTLFDCAVSTVAANDLPELIYIDHFGNAVTGLRAHWLDKSAQLQIGKNCFTAARTFSDVAIGQAFWYENANGLVEIAANQASAAATLNLQLGDQVVIV